MGGALSFTPNVDSLTEPGQKSILTSGIDGVTPDKLLEGIEKYVRDGKAVTGFEASVEVTDKDGGVLVEQTFPQGHKIFILYKFDKASNQVEISTFPGPVLFKKGIVTATCHMKVHNDPVQVESYVNIHAVRLSGPMLKGFLDGLLEGLDAKVDTTPDTPSISDSSKLSVVSGPIEGKPVDADTFLDAYTKFQIDNGATDLPDGSLIMERTNLAGLGVTTFSKHVVSKDNNCVKVHEYGTDSAMTDMRAIVTIQVHRDPFRLEMWREEVAARRAGDDELKIVQPVLEGVLKEMTG